MKVENFKNEGVRNLLTTAEAASRLRREPQTLRKWRSCGSCQIGCIKVSGRLLWSASDIDALTSFFGGQS